MRPSPSQWQQIEALFADLLSLEPVARALHLSNGELDPVVRGEVEALLAAADSGGDFLARSVTVVSTTTAVVGSVEQGALLGPWRILRLVGRGGMGEVYEAERADGLFQQRAAIKLLWQESEPLLRRFEAERQMLARLEHPGIARLLDGGVTPDGRPYAVMEFIAGQTLTDWCASRNSGWQERLELFFQICDAVSHAHKHLIVHRDLKPANTLVDSEGRARLLDFGIAKLLDGPVAPPETGGATGIGIAGRATQLSLGGFTPGYAAPEQLAGGAVTTATDVHALGLLLFELVTGRPLVAPPPDPAQATPVFPKRLQEDLDAVIAACINIAPDQRYASVDLLRLDVERAKRGEVVSVRAGEQFYVLSQFCLRHRAGLLVAATMVVLLSAFAISSTLQLRAIARERDRANLQTEKSRRVVEFMVGMFKVADPRRSGGASLTARELLDRASSRVETELASEPLQQAQLMAVMGDVYGSIGARSEATRLSKAALEVRLRVLGAEAEETLQSRNDWINRLRADGKCDEAAASARETMATATRTLGPDHPLTKRSLWILAVSEICRGRSAEAIPLLRDLAAWELERDGPDDHQLLATRNALASALSDEGQDSQAATLYEEVLAQRRRILGADHPDTLDTMTDLALARLDLGELTAAQALLDEQVPAFRKVLGPEHAKTLNAMSKLGRLYAAQGRLEESEKILLEVLEAQRRTLPADHPYIVGTMLQLGKTLAKAGRFAEQEKVHLEALTMERRARPQPSPYALELLYGLAASASLKGESATALARLRELEALGMPADILRRLRQDPILQSLRGNPEFEAIATAGLGSADAR